MNKLLNLSNGGEISTAVGVASYQALMINGSKPNPPGSNKSAIKNTKINASIVLNDDFA